MIRDGKVVKTIMRDFRIDEISAVDRPAQAGARAVLMKREAPVLMAMTTAEDGHSHLLVGVGANNESLFHLKSGQTSFADGHSHSWMLGEDGVVLIGDADGHSHGISNLVMKDGEVRDYKLARQDKDSNDLETVMQKQQQQDDVDVLRKRAERAERLAELTDAQKSYLRGLKDQDAFLAKDAAGREAEVAAAQAANEVVFKDEETGEVYRKNDDPRLVALAKRTAEERKLRRDVEAKALQAELEKQADSLKHLPGERKDHLALVKGLQSLPAEERDGALRALQARSEAGRRSFEVRGTSESGSSGDDVEDRLASIAKGIREKFPSLTHEQAMVRAMETPEGQALYAKHIGA